MIQFDYYFSDGFKAPTRISTTPAAPGDDSYAAAALVSGQHLVKSHYSNDSSDSDSVGCLVSFQNLPPLTKTSWAVPIVMSIHEQ